MSRRVLRSTCMAMLALASGTVSACGRSGPPAVAQGPFTGAPRFTVVAAENVWGSIAGQLAGDRASVQSVIVNPATDPHTYQPAAADARAIAGANVVVANGLGYDNWAGQLLGASPGAGRVALDIGQLLGLGVGANPHRWYYPADVRRVVVAIVAAYGRVDPADAAYFKQREQQFEKFSLAPYDRLRAEIRTRYAGFPVGYSESIFQGLGEDLHLRLLTPPSFVRAIAEGTEVTAADRATVEAQVRTRQIRLWVFNSQNVTPDVQRVNQLAVRQKIPIATVTESLVPGTASFAQWQVGQLEALLRALRTASVR